MRQEKIGDLLFKFPRKRKIPASEYTNFGQTPVIDQSSDTQIAGYTDDSEARHEQPLPITVFGDHTRVVKFANFPFASGADGTQLLYPNTADVDPTYFYYAVSNVDLSNYFYARHFKFLKEQNIPIPKLSVQKRIAEILQAYDDLIENNRRRMALLEESARQLYREWFVRLRFPGYEHTRITDSVPQGWEQKTLGDVAHINQASLGSNFDGEIEYIDIASVTPGVINETTPYQFRDAPSRARRVVSHGGVSRILCKRVFGQCCGIRSSNWMVNRFRAAFQSRMGIVHFSLMFLSAR